MELWFESFQSCLTFTLCDAVVSQEIGKKEKLLSEKKEKLFFIWTSGNIYQAAIKKKRYITNLSTAENTVTIYVDDTLHIFTKAHVKFKFMRNFMNPW